MTHMHSILALVAMVGPSVVHVFLNWREAVWQAFAAAVVAQDAFERSHHCEVRPDQREKALVFRTRQNLMRLGHIAGKEAIRGQVRRMVGPQFAR